MSEQNQITFITQPLSFQEIKQQLEENQEINVNVLVSANDMIDRDAEEFDEWMDEIILDNFSIISGISYVPVGIHDDQIILNVFGEIEDWEEKVREAEAGEDYDPYHDDDDNDDDE